MGSDEKTGLTLESPTVKYIGIGLLIAGVGLGAFALLKEKKGKKSSKGGKLSGVSQKRLRSGKRSKRAKKVNF